MTYNGNPNARDGQPPVHAQSYNTNYGGPSVPDAGGFNPAGNLPTPYQPPAQVVSPATPAAGARASSLLGNLPLKDIKGWIDRMGGVEGIMNTVNKMSRIAQTFQQMSPMIKLLMSNFLKKRDSTDKFNEDYKEYRRRRKRNRGRRTASRRRPLGARPPGRGGKYARGRAAAGGAGRNAGRRRPPGRRRA